MTNYPHEIARRREYYLISLPGIRLLQGRRSNPLLLIGYGEVLIAGHLHKNSADVLHTVSMISGDYELFYQLNDKRRINTE